MALFPQAQLLLPFYLNFSETYQYSVLLITSQLCQASTLRYLGEKLGVHCTFSVLFEDFSPTFLDSKPDSLEAPWGKAGDTLHCASCRGTGTAAAVTAGQHRCRHAAPGRLLTLDAQREKGSETEKEGRNFLLSLH